jgi:hypothetical protein
MQAEASNVPFFPQEDNFCGPAALATVVAWSGISVEPEQIAERVYTPGRKGTLQSDILAAARREGRLAVPVTSLRDVMTEIAAGHPVRTAATNRGAKGRARPASKKEKSAEKRYFDR